MSIFKPTGNIVARKLWSGEQSYEQHLIDAHGGYREKSGLVITAWPVLCDCPTTVEVEWTGGRIVDVGGATVKAARTSPKPHLYAIGNDRIVFGGVRLLLLGIKVCDGSCYADVYLAMKDGPRAVCMKMLRTAIERFMYRFVWAEAWWRSYGIPQLNEGELMPAASWLAKRLL